MYTDSINQFNGMSVVSGLSNVCICGDAIGDPKEIIIPNGFNPLTDNYIAIKAVFLNGHNAVNDSTYLTVKCKYANGDYVQDGADVVQIPIMANKDGSLINIPIHTMDVSGTTTYKVLQANTVLEMYYDPNANGGNGAFVVIGNPIVLSANDSNSSYTVYANGLIKQSGIFTGDNWQVIPLLIPYSNKNYVVLGTVDTSVRTGDAVFQICRSSSNFTNSQIYISTFRGGDSGALHNWVTIGY